MWVSQFLVLSTVTPHFSESDAHSWGPSWVWSNETFLAKAAASLNTGLDNIWITRRESPGEIGKTDTFERFESVTRPFEAARVGGAGGNTCSFSTFKARWSRPDAEWSAEGHAASAHLGTTWKFRTCFQVDSSWSWMGEEEPRQMLRVHEDTTATPRILEGRQDIGIAASPFVLLCHHLANSLPPFATGFSPSSGI